MNFLFCFNLFAASENIILIFLRSDSYVSLILNPYYSCTLIVHRGSAYIFVASLLKFLEFAGAFVTKTQLTWATYALFVCLFFVSITRIVQRVGEQLLLSPITIFDDDVVKLCLGPVFPVISCSNWEM